MPTYGGSSATTVLDRRKNDQGLARTLLDTVDALIVALDTTGRIVTFNGACERATGWASEEVVGRYLWDLLIPEEERESVRAVFSHLTATSLPCRHTNSWLTRSGGRVVIEWSNAVVPGPSGAVELVLGTGIDVTARREAERDLEALFETMVDGIALHQVVVDRAARPVDFRYLRVNPAFERIMGLAVASLVGRTTSEVLADARWNEALGQAALSGQPAHFEVEQTRAHSRLEVTAYGSGPGHVAAIVVDVSTRRRAEEALRAIVAGTAGVTGADFFAHLAEHLARALGVRTALVAEIEGGVASRARTLAVWDRGAPRPAFAYELAGTPGEVAASQGTCFVPDGVQSRFPGDCRLQDLDAVSYMASLLRDPQGKAVGLMAIADDKPMQDAEPAQSLLSIFSARAAAELSRLQAEAAKDRVEAQLRQAQRMEAVGQLAGGVAHDFNNMLQAIVGHTDIALDRVGEQHPAAADLLDARRAVERATTLTRQLLTFSRREALRPEVLSLNDLVDDMTKMLRRVLGETVELDVRAEPTLQPVLGDRGQIEQVLLNLCINARDAMPDGGTLTIVTSSAGPRDEDGDTAARVCLSVSDTGTGNPCRDPRAHLRALLHDEGDREGHRPGARDRVRHRRETRRVRRLLERGGPGDDLQSPDSRDPRDEAAQGDRTCRRDRPRGHRDDLRGRGQRHGPKPRSGPAPRLRVPRAPGARRRGGRAGLPGARRRDRSRLSSTSSCRRGAGGRSGARSGPRNRASRCCS